MFNEPVVFVDIETTGGSYKTSRIIEFAAIRIEKDEIVDTYHTLINPAVPLPSHITRLTGITSDDLRDAPHFDEVAHDIQRILKDAVFAAHHVRFDYSFVKRQLEGVGVRYNPKLLCSVRLSRALYPESRGHSLQKIIERHDIAVSAHHRALDDARAVWDFVQIAHRQHGPEAFASAVARQFKQKTLPPHVNPDNFASIPDSPGVYTFLDANNMPIYIGKSVTLRSRVMSHFAGATKLDKEMKLSLGTHNISFIETDNELEALLLESQMIKDQLPIYNQRLRRVQKMYRLSRTENPDGYATISIDLINGEDLTPDNTNYGVFSSQRKAKQALERLQMTYDLCPKLLGLEKASRACFKYQLHKCRGACIGDESPFGYNERFETAFARTKLDEWPYSNPIVLSHTQDTQSGKNLVIDNWRVIGELHEDEACETHFKPWQSVFDIDTYKIIRSYLAQKSNKLRLRPISYKELNSFAA